MSKVYQVAIINKGDGYDSALYVNGSIISSVDGGESMAEYDVLHEVASSLASTLGVPLTDLAFNPDNDDWTWDDATPETVSGLMQSESFLKSSIMKHLDDIEPEDLDAITHELASEMATGVNQDGVEAQLEFIAIASGGYDGAKDVIEATYPSIFSKDESKGPK